VLSGKYNGKQAEKDARYTNEMMRTFLPARERQDRVVAALQKVAEQTGRSPAQTALAWLRTREIPVIPIIGARKMTQLEDNLASLTLTLSPEQVNTLDEASSIELGFPGDFYRRDMVREFVYGGMRDRIVA
jgi:aryl-alcohol dehydrogenase-like predicted oxidoreductase